MPQQVNAVLGGIYSQARVPVAAVESAFHATDFTPASAPLNVTTICAGKFMGRAHPDDAADLNGTFDLVLQVVNRCARMEPSDTTLQIVELLLDAGDAAVAAAIREVAAVLRGAMPEPPADPDALLTSEQVGELLQLSPRTLKDQTAAKLVSLFPHLRSRWGPGSGAIAGSPPSDTEAPPLWD
ncbi:hypothetical protein ACQPXB_27765 [Amycolatopsis sp. CA-161197]|uniref:hypothetical protein n=1 Tax=Amycolatopsis sp. CA-161197 TaxID=3239922 RepID=UPI003D91FAFC